MLNGPSPRSPRRTSRLLLAILLGAAAAAGVYFYVSSLQQSAALATQTAARGASAPAATSRIVVARVTVAANSPLNPDQFELREIPPDAVAPNALTALNQLQGKVLSVPVAA